MFNRYVNYSLANYNYNYVLVYNIRDFMDIPELYVHAFN